MNYQIKTKNYPAKPDIKIGIIVNPFSGRDVRRVAARASTSDHQEKQQQVTRLALGALSQGVNKIYLAHDPFRINEKAVENLPERDKMEVLRFNLTHSAEDTTTMAQKMWERGCKLFIVLGGDGTSRVLARAFPNAVILPLSTGTNNVLPYRVEASVAGMAAGLVATGKVPRDTCLRCKQIHIKKENKTDIALIDAVLLKDDFMGSMLPFKAENLSTVLLTRAEPASIGISPIGGFFEPTGHHDDHGVLVQCDPRATRQINVPISPGLHSYVGVDSVKRIALRDSVKFQGPGVLAFDGDRTIKLSTNDVATATVIRDGPFVVEAEKVMAIAASTNQF